MQAYTNELIDKLDHEQLRHMLRLQLARNELLVTQNKFDMFRYECSTGEMHLTLRLPDGQIQHISFPDYLTVVPSHIFEEKEHARAVDNIRRVINDPDAPKTGSVAFTYKSGRHVSCEYTSVFGENGEVIAIVGQLVDMYSTHERLVSTIHSLSERSIYIETIGSIYETAIDFNLKNKTYKVLRATPAVRAVTGHVNDIETLAKMFCNFYIEKEFHEAFYEFINMESLSKRMYGHKFLSCQYKTTNIGWCEARIIPIVISTSGIVERAFFATEIIESKRETLNATRNTVTTDTLTGLLNASSAESIINISLQSKHEGLFIKLRCDYFDAIISMLGQSVSELLLIEIAKTVQTLYPLDILSRLRNDEFVFYITNSDVIATIKQEGPNAILKQINDKMKNINLPELMGITISACAGLVFLKNNFEVEYKELYKRASKLCQKAMSSGAKQLCFEEI